MFVEVRFFDSLELDFEQDFHPNAQEQSRNNHGPERSYMRSWKKIFAIKLCKE